MRKRALIAPVAAALVMGGGCSMVREATAPTCANEANPGTTLAAQSVPSATRVPCIASYPAGWSLSTVEIRSGLTSFTLDNDRGGHGALKVSLRRTCDVSNATEVPTDEPETRRFEQVLSIDSGYRGERYYIFPGGCVTYRLRFEERGQALVNEASIAVGFQTRKHIDEEVRRVTSGQRHL